mgnify:CR=1 FL=1
MEICIGKDRHKAKVGDQIGYVHICITKEGWIGYAKQRVFPTDSQYPTIKLTCSDNPVPEEHTFTGLTTTFGNYSAFFTEEEMRGARFATFPFIYGKGLTGNYPSHKEISLALDTTLQG